MQSDNEHPSDMTFEELGKLLRAERERQDLSVEDVANTLKINVRVLRALEDADVASLPHGAYVQGFVRSYSRLLGIDSDERIQSSVTPSVQEDVSPTFIRPRKKHASQQGSRSRIFLFFFVCICLIGIVAVWMHRDANLFSDLHNAQLIAEPAPPLPTGSEEPAKESVKTEQESRAPEKSENEVVVEDASKPVSTRQSVDTHTSQESVDVRQNTTQSTSENTQGSNAQSAPIEQETVIASNVAESSASELLGVPHRIVITAVAECWIHSTADTTDTRQFSLSEGDTFALTFTESLTIKLGNAGGVRIRYNGNVMPVPGKDGEVKTISFPPVL